MLLKGVLSFCLLNRRSDVLDSATCCSHSLALTRREAGGTAVLHRNLLSAYHFPCLWIVWSFKSRYSSFENKAKKEKDTGGKKLVCNTAQKRMCLEHQSSGSAVCLLCPLWGQLLVEVRPCHRGTTHFLEVFQKSIHRCSEFTWI